MGRGILSGAFWGILFSGAAVSVASLVTELPPGNNAPVAPQTEVSAGNSEAPLGDATGVAPLAGEETIELGNTPLAPVTDDSSDAPIANTQSSETPETGVVENTIDAPSTEQAPVVNNAAQDPILPNPQGIAPAAPTNEEGLNVSTEPAAPPPPVVVAETPEEIVVSDDVPAASAPEAETAPVMETPAQEAPQVTEVPTIDVPENDLTGNAVADTQSATPPLEAPTAAPEEPEPAVEEPEVTSPRLQLQNSESAPDEPRLPGGNNAPAVIRLGSETVVVVEPAAGESDVAPLSGPALEIFAGEYEDPAGKPTMSIILIDDGSLDGAIAAVQSLPFSVTIGLSATKPGASEAAGNWRAAGFEVMALAALPVGAQPSDAEVTLQAAFGAMSQSIGLLDAGEGGLQEDRGVTDQAMAILAADGRGLITASKGLNMALRSAEQANVPASVIYRDLDAEDQDARVIRRFLDQAAFRARQDSGITLLGRIRPDTISALTLWGTANRAGQVAIVPVSAMLLPPEN